MMLLIAVPLGLIAGVVVAIYNRLVGLRNRCCNAFSEIDIQLKRRHDLIPNLVQTASGYLQHERGTLEAVSQARARAVAAERGTMRELGEAETALSGALGRLLAVAEAYPQLKANETMSMLMEDLTTTENRIAFARQAYNDAAMFYNTALQSVPANWIASAGRFAPAEFFALENSGDKAASNVSFS